MRRTLIATTGVLALGAGLIVPATASLAADAGSSIAAVDAGKRKGVKLTLKGPKTDPVAGDAVTVKGKATVKKQPVAKAKVKLLRKKGSKWVTVGKTTTNKKGKYRKQVTLPNKPTVDVRAKLVKPTRVKGTSSTTLTVTFAQPAQAPVPSSPAPSETSSPAPSETSNPEVPVDAPTLVDCNSDTVTGAVVAASAGDTLNITGTCNEAGITIDKDLTLTGDGTIDATNLNDRVLTNNPGINLTITGSLTIQGGNAPVEEIELFGSTQSRKIGGGIYNNGGTVTLNDSTSIQYNVATDLGGGIYSNGWVTLNDSAFIVRNEAGSGGSNESRFGGGIFNHGGTVTLNRGTTIGNNKASHGGGIFNYSTGMVNLMGGGIGGNTAANGGGIYNWVGTVTLNSGTITGNTAYLDGGGIYNNSGTVDQLMDGIVGGNAPDNIFDL